MSIFPQCEETIIEIFECPICTNIYIRGNSNVICCVMHAPGTCCHYTDKKIDKDKLNKIQDVIDGKPLPD